MSSLKHVKSSSGGSRKLNKTMRVPCSPSTLSNSRNNSRSVRTNEYRKMTAMWSSHFCMFVGSLATYFVFPLAEFFSIFQENIGMRMSSNSASSRNDCERKATCAYPSRFVKMSASFAKRIDPDLNPIPNRPTFPTLCSLSLKPKESIPMSERRFIPHPSSWTTMP